MSFYIKSQNLFLSRSNISRNRIFPLLHRAFIVQTGLFNFLAISSSGSLSRKYIKITSCCSGVNCNICGWSSGNVSLCHSCSIHKSRGVEVHIKDSSLRKRTHDVSSGEIVVQNGISLVLFLFLRSNMRRQIVVSSIGVSPRSI